MFDTHPSGITSRNPSSSASPAIALAKAGQNGTWWKHSIAINSEVHFRCTLVTVKKIRCTELWSNWHWCATSPCLRKTTLSNIAVMWALNLSSRATKWSTATAKCRSMDTIQESFASMTWELSRASSIMAMIVMWWRRYCWVGMISSFLQEWFHILLPTCVRQLLRACTATASVHASGRCLIWYRLARPFRIRGDRTKIHPWIRGSKIGSSNSTPIKSRWIL